MDLGNEAQSCDLVIWSPHIIFNTRHGPLECELFLQNDGTQHLEHCPKYWNRLSVHRKFVRGPIRGLVPCGIDNTERPTNEVVMNGITPRKAIELQSIMRLKR